MSTETLRHRGRVAALVRHQHSPDSPEVLEARRDLAESKIADAVAAAVASAPPLTPEQVNRLARLLMNAGGGE